MTAGVLVLFRPGINDAKIRAEAEEADRIFESIQAEAFTSDDLKSEGVITECVDPEEDMLFEDGTVVATISIPSINVHLPVYYGQTEENMRKGAVLMRERSELSPDAGVHAVICAHRSNVAASFFRYIDKIKIGNEVTVNTRTDRLVYEVVGCAVTEPTCGELLAIKPEKNLLTLSSCHPYGSTEMRYLVQCELVETETRSSP